MSYLVSGGSHLNLVLSHHDETDPATWTRDQDAIVAAMKREYAGWDEAAVAIVDSVTSTLKWPLMTYPPLETWRSSSGRFALLGDAPHAMLPCPSASRPSPLTPADMSSGAAMAIEDGVVLGRCLGRARSAADVPFALETYEHLRFGRAHEVQRRSALNGKVWHFADGPQQTARDEGMAAEVRGVPFASSTNQWSDPTISSWLCAVYTSLLRPA